MSSEFFGGAFTVFLVAAPIMMWMFTAIKHFKRRSEFVEQDCRFEQDQSALWGSEYRRCERLVSNLSAELYEMKKRCGEAGHRWPFNINWKEALTLSDMARAQYATCRVCGADLLDTLHKTAMKFTPGGKCDGDYAKASSKADTNT